jgi:hypothetical protein
MRLVIAMMLLMATAVPSGAQRYVRDWNQLSPQEQQRAWDNYRRYQQMPQQRRDTIDNRFQRFQQQRLRQNYDMYHNQNPAQRQQFNEQYRRWRSGRQ